MPDSKPRGKRRKGEPEDAPKRVDTSDTVTYSEEELEFLRAVEKWKAKYHRQYPTCCDLLVIAKSLGYKKVS